LGFPPKAGAIFATILPQFLLPGNSRLLPPADGVRL